MYDDSPGLAEYVVLIIGIVALAIVAMIFLRDNLAILFGGGGGSCV